MSPGDSHAPKDRPVIVLLPPDTVKLSLWIHPKLKVQASVFP
jgi:hypothetical protein